MEQKLRILVAKPGLDGHDRGAKIIARVLRDAGYEVIYTGIHQTPEMIITAALQEDVDVICISVLSGAHNFLFPEILKLLKEKGLKDITIIGGGVIPDEDVKFFNDTATTEIYTPGTDTRDVVKWIEENVKARKLD
jgi:methylmalonyl-CoA mutase C-terminal domain/subunit